MKRFNLNTAKTMTFAVIAGVSSVFGITSCQQDDYDFDCAATQAPTVQNAPVDVADEDSIIVEQFKFDYDNMGTSSAAQYVADINFGPESNPTASRAAATPSTEETIKTLFKVAKSENIATWDFSTIPVIRQMDRYNESLRDVKDMALELKKNAADVDTKDYFTDYLFGFDDYNTNGKLFASYISLLKCNDKEAAYEVADTWAQREFRGTTAALAIRDLMVYITYFRTNQMTAPEMYDRMVFQTTPWEHMGYQKREQLRLADVAVVTSGYILARAFYEHQIDIAQKAEDSYAFNCYTCRLRSLNEAYDAFERFYESYAGINRHDDLLICQIKGANIVFEKNLNVKDMYNHPWCPNDGGGFRWLEKFMYSDGVFKVDKQGHVNGIIHPSIVLSKSLTNGEAENIFNYYNPKDENNNYINPVKTFDEIMKEAGFEVNVLENGKKHVMTLQDQCHKKSCQWIDLFDNGKYEYYFNKVLVTNDAKTFFKDWKVGTMKIKDIRSAIGTSENINVIDHWADYPCKDCQFFYTSIRKRYSNMQP